MTYAAGTKVPPERSRMEIESTLKRFGADQFLYGHDVTQVMVAFRYQGRHVRFTVKLPEKEQAVRERYRALLLAIKSKLTVVEVGIATFEDEFMAHVVLPDGSTVGEWMAPQIEAAYQDGRMPNLLPALGTGK